MQRKPTLKTCISADRIQQAKHVTINSQQHKTKDTPLTLNRPKGWKNAFHHPPGPELGRSFASTARYASTTCTRTDIRSNVRQRNPSQSAVPIDFRPKREGPPSYTASWVAKPSTPQINRSRKPTKNYSPPPYVPKSNSAGAVPPPLPDPRQTENAAQTTHLSHIGRAPLQLAPGRPPLGHRPQQGPVPARDGDVRHVAELREEPSPPVRVVGEGVGARYLDRVRLRRVDLVAVDKKAGGRADGTDGRAGCKKQ